MKKIIHAKIFILILISILITIGCKDKLGYKNFDKYNPLVWTAMIAYENRDYENSLLYFQKAFEIIPDESEDDIFHAAAAALRVKKDDVAEELIRTAISKTNPRRDYYNSFHGFVRFKEKQLFKRIEKDYEQLVNQFYSELSYPKEIEDEIQELIKKDQEVRQNSDWDKMAKVDSININRLIEITSKHGWIKKGWLLLWHHRGIHREDNYVWNHFRPLINREIKEGKIKKDFWAMYDDELSIRNNQEQIYGMYQNQFPVKEIETVDERRTELGLPPLWYLNKIYGHELPNGYSTKIKDIATFKELYSIELRFR